MGKIHNNEETFFGFKYISGHLVGYRNSFIKVFN